MFFVAFNLVLAALCFLIIGHIFLLYKRNNHLNGFFVLILLFVAVPRVLLFIEGFDVKDIMNSTFWDHLSLTFIYLLVFQWYFKVLLNKVQWSFLTIGQIVFGVAMTLMGITGLIDPRWSKIIFVLFGFWVSGEVFVMIKTYLKTANRKNPESKVFILWLKIIFAVAIYTLTSSIGISVALNQVEPSYIRAAYRLNGLVWFGTCLYILYNPLVLYGVEVLQESLLKPKLNDLKLWELTPTRALQNSDKALHQRIQHKTPFNIASINELVEKKNDTLIKGRILNLLSSALHIPESHLKYLFKYHCTLSVKEFENYLKIMMAIELIEQQYLRERTVASLAETCHFSSRSAFYDNFKKFTGETVTKFLT